MHFGDTQYLPVAPPFVMLLVGMVGLLAVLVQLRILQFVYVRLGVSPQTAVYLLVVSVLLASLIGALMGQRAGISGAS